MVWPGPQPYSQISDRACKLARDRHSILLSAVSVTKKKGLMTLPPELQESVWQRCSMSNKWQKISSLCSLGLISGL